MENGMMGKWPRFILWALATAILDLGSKYLALVYLGDHRPVEIIPGLFNLQLAYNTGAAFSLFAGPQGDGQSLKMAALALVSLIPLTYFLIKAKRGERFFISALGLIYGGAMGNIHDRLSRGAVVDFLDFYWRDKHWPAFNLADAAIIAGAVMIVIVCLFSKDSKSNKNGSPS